MCCYSNSDYKSFKPKISMTTQQLSSVVKLESYYVSHSNLKGPSCKLIEANRGCKLCLKDIFNKRM